MYRFQKIDERNCWIDTLNAMAQHCRTIRCPCLKVIGVHEVAAVVGEIGLAGNTERFNDRFGILVLLRLIYMSDFTL